MSNPLLIVFVFILLLAAFALIVYFVSINQRIEEISKKYSGLVEKNHKINLAISSGFHQITLMLNMEHVPNCAELIHDLIEILVSQNGELNAYLSPISNMLTSEEIVANIKLAHLYSNSAELYLCKEMFEASVEQFNIALLFANKTHGDYFTKSLKQRRRLAKLLLKIKLAKDTQGTKYSNAAKVEKLLKYIHLLCKLIESDDDGIFNRRGIIFKNFSYADIPKEIDDLEWINGVILKN